MSDVKNLINRLNSLKTEINEILDKGIIEFLEDYKNSELPLFIHIRGYTPGFNDGEPCTHGVLD